jgi:hypothetical protein
MLSALTANDLSLSFLVCRSALFDSPLILRTWISPSYSCSRTQFTTMMKCLHFFRYALSSLEMVTTAELSSRMTAGSNSGMLTSDHMYMMNISAWVDDVETRVCLALLS